MTWGPSLLANQPSYVVRKPSYIWSTIVLSLFVFWFACFFFPFFLLSYLFFRHTTFPLLSSSCSFSSLYYRQTVLFFSFSCPRHCVTNKSYIKIKNIQCDDVFSFLFFSDALFLWVVVFGRRWLWLSWRLFRRHKVTTYTF